MNARRRRILTLTLAAAVATGIAIAQLMEPEPSPAPFFPAGALVYAEARDLNRLLAWWRDSDLKSRWQETSNYAEFENSRLYQRLDERLEEFGKGEFSFTLDHLSEIAGTRSAIALYDIGELKAVAVTRVGFAEATASSLWGTRPGLTKRKVGNQNYYIEPKDGKFAFAYARPYLVVASEEALLQDVLKAMRSDGGTPAADTADRITQSEKWLQCMAQKPAGDGFFTLYLDQENLNTNNYFRNYWLHQNADDLKQIRAAWIDLELNNDSLVERRYFVKDETQRSAQMEKTDASAAEYLKAFDGLHRESLQLTASPTPSGVAEHVARLFHRFTEEYRRTAAPPAYSAAVERASRAESRSAYLEKIDEAVLKPASEKMLRLDQPEKLRAWMEAAAPVAELRLAYPLWDDRALFVQFPESIVVQFGASGSPDPQQFLDTMLDYYRILHSTQDRGAQWVPFGAGSFKLNSLSPVFVRFQAPWLVVSNREQEFQQVVAALPAASAPPPASYVEIDLEKARWKYSRLMRRLDTGAFQGDSPLFFSDNLDSLLQAGDAVHRVTITRAADSEVLRYELE